MPGFRAANLIRGLRLAAVCGVLLTSGTARGQQATEWWWHSEPQVAAADSFWLVQQELEQAAAEAEPPPELPLPFGLPPLEEFAQQPYLVPGPSPATLTLSEPAGVPGSREAGPLSLSRSIPAAVTRIDEDTIWSSGARNLNELFDILVPNAQVIRHHAQGPHLGFRGIISDKDDKYLLRVNGRLMNNRSQIGAFSEHFLPLLGDIHHIDVIRGPGSTIYGPGAISGVVNIVTHNGLTFEGTDATVRGGLEEYFTAVEVRRGVRLSDDSGLFLYYGYADYPGAPQAITPYVFGRSFTALEGTPVVAGQPVTFDIPHDHRSYRAQGRHKLHVQYTLGNWDTWVRYTRSGEQNVPRRDFITTPPLGSAAADTAFADLPTDEAGYQQVTVFTGYHWEATEDLNVDLALSYDMFDLERLTQEVPSGYIAHREDEWFSRILATWEPVEQHSFALGAEYSYEQFGLDSPGFPHRPAYTPRQREQTRPWSTNTWSLLGEYQWRINDCWAAFLSGRGDRHTYTPWLFSPRAAVVWMPNQEDTLKFIAAEAVRRVEDDVLRSDALQNNEFSKSEKLGSLELRYERRPDAERMLGISTFYQDSQAVAFARAVGEATGRSQLLGEFQMWGIELEGSYRSERTYFLASHAYTDLVDAHLNNPAGIVQGISAYPYNDVVPGNPFGAHLANWSPFLTKFYVARDLDCCWSASSSLRIYWGFPGAEDLTEYNNLLLETTGAASPGLGLSDPGYDRAFAGNYYLDAGLERKIGRRGVLRLDCYNILGWFDEDLNKRNYLNRLSEYRVEAAAVAISARVSF